MPGSARKKADLVAKMDGMTVIFELKRVRSKDVRTDSDTLKGDHPGDLEDVSLTFKQRGAYFKSVGDVAASADVQCREYMQLWKAEYPCEKVLGFVVVFVTNHVVVRQVDA